MTLTIICPESKRHRSALNRALMYVGINDYQILDPAHHNVGKSFSLALFIGELSKDRLDKLSKMSQQAWIISAPNLDATVEEKKQWLEKLKKIQDWILSNQDKDNFKKADVPNIMQLKTYLNSKIGQVIEVVLPDRRKLGIYPDAEKMQGEYDIEYHASTVLNIAKLFNLFGASEIIIKEL